MIGVNGNDYSWGHITFKVDGERFSGFFKISYSHKRTRTKGYADGKAHKPTHRSSGKYEVDAVKVSGYKDEIAQLREALANKAGSGSYGDAEFEGVVEFESPTGFRYDELERLTWAEEGLDHGEETDLLTEEISFDCMGIKRDGLTLYADESGDLAT